MPHDALTRLVGDARSFLAGTFGRAPLHVRGADPSGFVDVLSLDDVDHVVSATGLRAPAFRLVRDGVTLPTHQLTRDVRIGSRPVGDLVDVAAVHRAFADGATLVLQGLHRSWSPVAALCRELEAALTHPVQANAYLTPPVAQGLHLHADPHDVFAVQTHGVKRWVVHPPGDETPWDLELRPGDVLYLPAGTRHAAQTVELASLHLTIGVRTVRVRDVVRRAVTTLLDEVVDDRTLPGGWAAAPDDHRALVAAELERLAAALRERGAVAGDDALEAAAAAFWSGRTPDRRGGLLDLLEVDELDDATPLRHRPGAVARLEAAGDRTVLHLADRQLSFPAGVRPALERVLAAAVVRPKELEDLLDQASRLVLCRRLVREGWLTFDRPATEGRPTRG